MSGVRVKTYAQGQQAVNGGGKPARNALNEPLIEWLDELRAAAARRNNKSHLPFEKAIRAVRDHPDPIHHGAEAKRLSGVGDKIASFLEERLLVRYGSLRPSLSLSSGVAAPAVKRKKAAAVAPAALSGAASASDVADDEGSRNVENGMPRKRVRMTGPREYVPEHGSGGYAILLTLLQQQSDKGYLTKQELIYLAQPVCKSSFVFPEPGRRYTAWSNMNGLIKKGLVDKSSKRPETYALTDYGLDLARKLKSASSQMQSSPNGPLAAAALLFPSQPSIPASALPLRDATRGAIITAPLLSCRPDLNRQRPWLPPGLSEFDRLSAETQLPAASDLVCDNCEETAAVLKVSQQHIDKGIFGCAVDISNHV